MGPVELPKGDIKCDGNCHACEEAVGKGCFLAVIEAQRR
jgi:hypothetical protein